MKSFNHLFLIGLAIIAFLGACRKEEEYPIEPEIEYESFYVVSEAKAVITVSFTDGDGDIGLKEEETDEPYIGKYEHNFFVNMFFMKNGEFSYEDTIYFNSRIPILPDAELVQGIKGEVEYDLDWGLITSLYSGDTAYFEIYLVDRALHESNVVATPYFIVN